MAGFTTYLRAAFNARPLGMPLPPNWIGLAACGLLGAFLHPGFWLIGAGLEVGYLMTLVNHAGFRRFVNERHDGPVMAARRANLLAQLEPEQLQLQDRLDARCAEILDLPGADPALREQQRQQLAQLSWLHLRLLAARQAVRVVERTGASEQADLKRKLTALDRKREGAAADLTMSLDGQAEVLRARLAQFADANARLTVLDTEIDRLQQQADLLREQALLASAGNDTSGLSSGIGALGEALANTNRWMRDQQLTTDATWEQAPPLPARPSAMKA
jgi:cell division protein FtsB